LDTVETERLRIRPVQESDATSIALLVTPSVSRWTATWPSEISLEDAGNRITSAIQARQTGLGISFAIETKTDGTLVGWIGLRRKELDHKRWGLGYWIGEPFHGRGYMSEAGRAIIGLAWSLLDADVIEAAAQPGNAASIAILRKLGMRFAGQKMIFAPVRNQDELCVLYEVFRPI
jgi:ribosomal-protein-alanine N-acetyltransferase